MPLPIFDPDQDIRQLAEDLHRSNQQEVNYLDRVHSGEIKPDLAEFLAVSRRARKQLAVSLARFIHQHGGAHE